MKMTTKNLGLVFLMVLVIGVMLISGCSGGSSNEPSGGPSGGSGGGPSGGSGGGLGGGPTGDWCPTGTYYNSPQGNGKVTGTESHTINGDTVTLCCAEISSGGQAEIKVCFSKDELYGIVFNNANGAWVKTLETYPEGNQQCTRMFDEKGDETLKFCE